MPGELTWTAALGWRMSRQLLDPIGNRSPAEVVRRLGAVQSQVASSAELAIRVRRTTSAPGDVERALRTGRLIKTWAMRGALHLITPEDGGAFLAVLASGRGWERRGWAEWFGMEPRDWDLLRRLVADALADGPLTRQELGTRVAANRRLRHLREHFHSGWGTILHPLAWQGDICFGPIRDGRPTFIRTDQASARWAGLPPMDEAVPRVVAAYFGVYGPATVGNFHAWLGTHKRRVIEWLDRCADDLAEVRLDGERALILRRNLPALQRAVPSAAVRLLPGFDQYILGPGSRDPHLIPPGRRGAVSRQAGWISPIVVVGGVVHGTWALNGDQLRIGWFREMGRIPSQALEEEVGRLSSIVGQLGSVTVERV